MKETILKKASKVVGELDIATIATVDQEGFPRASTISVIKAEGLKTLWFSTGLSTGKVRCLKENNKASLCFTKDGHNITLMGTMDIVTDTDIKKALWVDWFIHHFPKGPTDPEYCILKFTSKKGVLWLDSNYFEFDRQDIDAAEA